MRSRGSCSAPAVASLTHTHTSFSQIQESTHLGISIGARDLLTAKISLREAFQQWKKP